MCKYILHKEYIDLCFCNRKRVHCWLQRCELCLWAWRAHAHQAQAQWQDRCIPATQLAHPDDLFDVLRKEAAEEQRLESLQQSLDCYTEVEHKLDWMLEQVDLSSSPAAGETPVVDPTTAVVLQSNSAYILLSAHMEFCRWTFLFWHHILFESAAG